MTAKRTTGTKGLTIFSSLIFDFVSFIQNLSSYSTNHLINQLLEKEKSYFNNFLFRILEYVKEINRCGLRYFGRAAQENRSPL